MRLAKNVPPEEFDWRNPDMPCCLPGQDNLTGKKIMLAIEPLEMQQNRKDSMFLSEGPNWRDDPTYNMRRRNAR
jgi:hypothetical protein